jgi:hemerythrin-like metal-binding protein
VALVAWKSEYSVGVVDLDAQHRRLFDLINRLHDSMRAGGSRTETLAVVDELLSYTRYHFGKEEEHMARAAYPNLPAHQQVHRAMVAEVERFREEVSRCTATAPLKLMKFLKNWLSRHILETDMRYRSAV